MRHTKSIILLFAVLVVLLSCSKQDWTETVTMPLSSSTNFDEGAVLNNRKLTVDSSQLYITSIHVKGERLQGEDVNVLTTSTFALNLLNTAEIDAIELPRGTYESLSISFSLTTNGYLDGTVENVNGNPNTKLITIPLDFQDKKLELDLFEIEENEVISIGEQEQSLTLTFDLQKTLTEVGIGPWNGLITASQSQTNIDINTIAGQNFLINFKEQLLENSSLILE